MLARKAEESWCPPADGEVMQPPKTNTQRAVHINIKTIKNTFSSSF